MNAACFHCGAAIPAGVDLTVVVQGVERPVCCTGCRAVAALIEDHGLARFYGFRTTPSGTPASERSGWSVCDRPQVARRIARDVAGGMRELTCRIDGVTCAACTWLIDRGLSTLEGVGSVAVNPLSGEATVRFDPARTRASEVLERIERLGFAPRVRLGAGARAKPSGADLKQLGVAGLGAMQVMTLSLALYAGAFTRMDTVFERYFALVSMLIATPVVLYAGAPIFRSAFADLARRRLGMDVPVALALAVALGASLVNALAGTGDVYFDSATMFVFLLTLARFVEARARHRAGSVLDALGDSTPLVATRRRAGEPAQAEAARAEPAQAEPSYTEPAQPESPRANGLERGGALGRDARQERTGAFERIGTIELELGDRVLVAPGEAVPADGRLVSARGELDEALLSGESLARARGAGDAVLGGSLNVGSAPIEVEVTRLGADSYVARVGGLLNRALAERPETLEFADRWASAFIGALLAITAMAAGAWLAIAPERALEVVLALLVVTCPCALSLAAPAAFAVALGHLARRGLLLASTRALERLRDVDLWMFDKTGTLTGGRIGVGGVTAFSTHSEHEALAIAAALETGIEHPIADALRSSAKRIGVDHYAASDVSYRPGFGVTGTVGGRRYLLGSARHAGAAADGAQAPRNVYLAEGSTLVARIELADELRPHARAALATLAASGAETMLASGDEPAVVMNVARQLGIARALAAQTPEGKLAALHAEQASGRTVAAVGDGINDAPLLAAADVSVAMVEGSRLARATADIVFTGDDLRTLARLPAYAAATRRIVRENLTWAAAYNLVAVPLAGTGVLSPWMAAVGMSISSLVVAGNALRVGHKLAALDLGAADRAAATGLADGPSPRMPTARAA